MTLNNNMNSCQNTNLEDCSYEPTGINAQFGYNTANLLSKENCYQNQMCCEQNAEVQNEMLCNIRALKFAITDIGEYLNTHSTDKRAICIHREHCQELRDLSDKYQKMYGPLSIEFPCNSWRWLEEPWPWERSSEE